MVEKHNRPKSAGSILPGLLAGSGLFLLAGWFLFGADLLDIPESRGVMVHKALISTAPLRQPLEDPPMIRIGAFQYTCMDCHKLFPARENPPEQLLQHRHVAMNHGINDQCRNCHDVFDRDRLALQGGASIPYSRVVELCSNCHGPTYRDWERGMHGRTNGYWDVTRGVQHRLGCTECHDPHSPRTPAMQPVTPLPPPHTLRMERPKEHGEAKELDPLRQVLIRGSKTRKTHEEEEEF